MQVRSREEAAEVLKPKVRGTRVLEKVLHHSQLDFFALCSSRSAILGGFGNIDYCAANAYLDAFAHYRAKVSDTFTVSINWPTWQGVGMLVNAAAQYGVKEAGHVTSRTVDHPLFDTHIVESRAKEKYVTRFSVNTHWVLDEHRIVGRGVLAGVTYLEMARAAVAAFAEPEPGKVIELHNVIFLTPFSLRDDESGDLNFVIEKNGDGFEFHVLSQQRLEGGQAKWLEHAMGEARYGDATPAGRRDLQEIKSRCLDREIVGISQEELDENLGARWQNIKRVHLGNNELLAHIELPEEFSGDFEKLELHPALMDRAAGLGMMYLIHEGPFIPLSYKRIRIKAPLPRKIYSHIRYKENSYAKKETVSFDITVMDEHGTILVEVEEFSHKRINDVTAQLKSRSGNQYASVADHLPESLHSEDDRAVSLSDQNVYQKSLSEGATPEEGVEAFRRILSHDVAPQIIVSPKDLQVSIERTAAFKQSNITEEIEKFSLETKPSHPRPDIQTPYVAPRYELEQAIAEVWQEMLGVEQVGIHDNFFELGGDSVQAIQILAKINKAGLQISIQQLFQHQTIAELAEVASNAVAATPAILPEPQPDATPTERAEAADYAPSDFPLAELDEHEFEKLSSILDKIDRAG
jgi:aryl carrier-like protein